MTDDIDEPPRPPCEHCGHLADTVIVVRRIVTYERHSPSCPVIAVTDHTSTDEIVAQAPTQGGTSAPDEQAVTTVTTDEDFPPIDGRER